MSGGNLRLQVILQAVDQATAPFRKIMAGSKGLAATLQQQQGTLRRLNAAHRDIGAFRQQMEATRGVSQAHKDAEQRVRQLAAQIAATANPSRKLNNEFKQAKYAAGQLKTQHQQQTAELQRLRGGLERAGISTRQLGTHERRLRADIAATTQQMATQRQRLAALDAAMARSKKIHSAGMNAAGHGAGMAFAGVGALRAEMLPLAQAMAFESAMADVKKVVDFDTPQQFIQMSRDVEDLSRRLPMIPADIAKIVAAAGQAAIPRKELLQFAKDAAEMGVAFDTTAEDAGQTMATWRTAFRMSQSDVVVLADKINYLGNTGPASVQKISEVVNRIGALGEVAGLGSGPIAALGATVAGMGIESEVSATGIKNMLLTLSSGAAATKSQILAFDKLGLKAGEMARAMQRDAGGAIVEVLEKLKQLPKAEQAATMTQLFGRESIGAIAPLLTNLELLQGNFKKVSDAQQYSGSMSAEYASRVATSANAWQLLKNVALVVSQSLGKTLLPDFKRLAERAAVVVGKVVDLIRANPQLVATIAKLTIAGTALVTVLGGLLVAGGVSAMALTQIHKAVLLLSGGGGISALVRNVLSLGGRAFPMLLNVGRMLLPLLGGVSAPVLAIGAAIGVVALLVWKYWGPIKAFMIGVWQGIADVVGPLMTELRTALEPLAPVWDMISDAMGKAWAWVKELLVPFEATSEQLEGATDAGRGFGRVLGTVLTVNLRAVVAAIKVLVSAFMVLLPIIQNVMGGAWSYLQGIWSLIVGLFTLNGDKLRGGVQMMWDGVNGVLMGWPQRMHQAGMDMVMGLVNGITSMGGSAIDAVAGVATGVMDRFKGMLGIHSPSRVFAQFGDFTMQGLAGGLGRSQAQPLQQLTGLGERMRKIGAGLTLGVAALPAMAAPNPVAAPAATAALPVSITALVDAVMPAMAALRMPVAVSPVMAALPQLVGSLVAPLSVAERPAVTQSRPVVAQRPSQAPVAQPAPASYIFHIHAAPGMDAQAIALEVRRQLDAHERAQTARRGSRLTD